MRTAIEDEKIHPIPAAEAAKANTVQVVNSTDPDMRVRRLRPIRVVRALYGTAAGRETAHAKVEALAVHAAFRLAISARNNGISALRAAATLGRWRIRSR